MIQIIGSEGTSEYQAAVDLRREIEKEWPSVVNDKNNVIYLVVGVQCHGQQTRDVDLLLLAELDPPLPYHSFLSFQDYRGNLHSPDKVLVRSLCVTIEIKEHLTRRSPFYRYGSRRPVSRVLA